MNRPELRELRIITTLGKPLPYDSVAELIEDTEKSLDACEAHDTDELVTSAKVVGQ